MRCIICLLTKDESEGSHEHIIPESLGSPKLHIKDVCKTCNDQMGHHLDSKLVNHQLVELARYTLGIKGKTGVPFPFRHKPTDPDTGSRVRVSENDKKQIVGRLLPHYQHRLIDGVTCSSVSLDARDADDLALARRLIQGIFKNDPQFKERIAAGEVTVPDVTDVEVVTLIEEGQVTLSNGAIIRSEAGESKGFNQQIKIDLVGFMPAMVKVGYELAYRWLGLEFLSEPCADRMRKIITGTMAGTFPASDVNAALMDGGVAFAVDHPAFALMNDDPYAHQALMLKANGRWNLAVKVLNLFSAQFTLAHSPERYPGVDNMYLFVDPRTGATREHTWVKEFSLRWGGTR